MASSTRQYLGTEQVARRLGLDVGIVRRLLERRQLPGIFLDDVWLVPEQELDSFLRSEFRRQNAPIAQSGEAAPPAVQEPSGKKPRLRGRAHAVRVLFRGKAYEMPNYASAAISVIEQLASSDATFLQRLTAVRRGRRRYVAADRKDLYFNRPDLPARQMKNGWWIGTNYSRVELEEMLRIACRLSGLEFGSDLVITPAEPITRSQPERARAFVGIARSGLTDLAERHDEYLAQTLENARA